MIIPNFYLTVRSKFSIKVLIIRMKGLKSVEEIFEELNTRIQTVFTVEDALPPTLIWDVKEHGKH